MTYKYRIYPTRSQASRLENQFSMCRYLYNWNLEERINAYKEHGETISYNQQQNALPGLKNERPWFKSAHSQVLQDVLRRLDRAYDAFFRRVKQGLEAYSRPLGIDMGLIDFWYDSDGYSVPAPKHLRLSEKKLKRLQSQLSRAKAQQNWPRFRKLQKALAKCHYRVKCRSNDFLHKTANALLAKADLISYEDLRIRNMILRNRPQSNILQTMIYFFN